MTLFSRAFLYLSLGLVFLSISLARGESSANDKQVFDLPIESGQRLKISGFRGILELKGSENPDKVKIIVEKMPIDLTKVPEELRSNLSSWEPKVVRKGGSIELAFDMPGSKEYWSNKEAKKIAPEFKILVWGASLPVDIFWWNGKITAANWKEKISVTLHSGEANFSGLEGTLRLSLQSGNGRVSNHKGAIVIRSYEAKISVDKSEGAVEVDNFIGQTFLAAITGPVHMSSFNGKARLRGIKGNVDFRMQRAALDVAGLEGSLRGDNEDGLIDVAVDGAPDIRVRSKAGKITLHVPRMFSANVNVGSSEGDIFIPRHIKVQRGVNMKWAVGRLQGVDKQGNIFARSKSGTIRLLVR